MKKTAILAFLLFLFIGMAGATIPTPIYNAGHSGGDHFPGVVEAKYLTADSDAQVGGDLTVSGSATITGGYISAGVVNTDLTINNPHTLRLGTGAASADFGRGTGATILTQGTTYANNTVIKPGKYLKAGGNVVGNTIASNTSLIAGTTLATIGAAHIGEAATVNSLASNGTIVGGSSLAVITTAKIGTIAIVNELRLNNSAYLLGNIIQTGSTRETGTHWAGNIKSNGTDTAAGLGTFDSLKINTSMVRGSTASATNDTLTSASKSLYFIGAANGQRITLPAVSGLSGWTITFIVVTAATGSHLNIIDGTSAENINGAATIACATKYASISLVCTGTEWVATSIGQVGTWATYPGE